MIMKPSSKTRAEYRADRRATERVEAKAQRVRGARIEAARRDCGSRERRGHGKQKLADTRGRIADFDDVVNSADVPVSPLVREVILTSDNGPEIMYALSRNPPRRHELPSFRWRNKASRLACSWRKTEPLPPRPQGPRSCPLSENR